MDQKRYLALIKPAMEIVVKKHQDYGNDTLGLHSYFPFQDKSYVQMLHTKTQRLVALAQRVEGEPNFESITDSVQDLINYAVFYLDHLRSQK